MYRLVNKDVDTSLTQSGASGADEFLSNFHDKYTEKARQKARVMCSDLSFDGVENRN